MSLPELAQAQSIVNALDDRIAERIRQIAEALRAHVSIELTLKISDDRILIFGKDNGVWQLLVEDRTGLSEPLNGMPRHVRAEMIPEIERLIDSALEQLRAEKIKRESVLADADRILGRLA